MRFQSHELVLLCLEICVKGDRGRSYYCTDRRLRLKEKQIHKKETETVSNSSTSVRDRQGISNKMLHGVRATT